jgi:hypothetical protein
MFVLIIYPSENMFDKKEYQKKYYQEHKDKHDEQSKEWRLKHPEYYRKNYYPRNRERKLAQNSDYQKTHLEGIQKNHREWYHNKRMEAFEKLGGKCCECGESDWTCLQIDHIHGGGVQHHKKVQSYGIIIAVLTDPDAKSKYQLLCANCNWKKRFRLKEHNEHTKMWEFRKI